MPRERDSFLLPVIKLQWVCEVSKTACRDDMKTWQDDTKTWHDDTKTCRDAFLLPENRLNWNLPACSQFYGIQELVALHVIASLSESVLRLRSG